LSCRLRCHPSRRFRCRAASSSKRATKSNREAGPWRQASQAARMRKPSGARGRGSTAARREHATPLAHRPLGAQLQQNFADRCRPNSPTMAGIFFAGCTKSAETRPACQSASLSRSPVRMRTAPSTGATKIFP
jgi:hypothetical protein